MPVQPLVCCSGFGLHSGHTATGGWERQPQEGLAWALGDAPPQQLGPRTARNASGRLATDLVEPMSGRRLRTVEHWLGAAVGLGVGGLVLRGDGPELPAVGGSALEVAQALWAAAVQLPVLERWSPPVVIDVRQGRSHGRWYPAEPDSRRSLKVVYRLDFPQTVLGTQQLELDLTDPEHFLTEVAGARTFVAATSMEEVLQARQNGIGAGLKSGEGLVAGSDRWLHGEPLRWPNEAVRHKVLDLLGDLGTLGVRPAGTVVIERGGHALHRLMARVAAGWR
ncbi:MAG: UDP-3-O-acyl-N-acetylglucosamine deacetylase [Myxococcota bacterium]